MKYALEERLDMVRHFRKEGYNCAQCVVMAFSDLTETEQEKLAQLAHGFGGGIGGRGELCGAVSGMTMVVGMGSSVKDHRATYPAAATASERFEQLEGSLICRELKQLGKPCGDLIIDAVRIVHNQFAKE